MFQSGLSVEKHLGHFGQIEGHESESEGVRLVATSVLALVETPTFERTRQLVQLPSRSIHARVRISKYPGHGPELLLDMDLCSGGSSFEKLSHVMSVHTNEDVDRNAIVDDGQTSPFILDRSADDFVVGDVIRAGAIRRRILRAAKPYDVEGAFTATLEGLTTMQRRCEERRCY